MLRPWWAFILGAGIVSISLGAYMGSIGWRISDLDARLGHAWLSGFAVGAGLVAALLAVPRFFWALAP